MAYGAKDFSRTHEVQARSSLDVAADLFDFLGYDCIERVTKGQKHTVHKHRLNGDTIRVVSEMRLSNGDNLWNGQYANFRVPLRKISLLVEWHWYLSVIGRYAFLIKADDIARARTTSVRTYCSEDERMIAVRNVKVNRYLHAASSWLSSGPIPV